MTTVLQVLSGVLVGYLIVTVCESLFHRVIGHAPSRLRRLWGRAPRVGTFFLRAWYAHHIVHHLRTFRRDHVTQFSSPGEEARLRSGLVAQGRGHVVERDYGLRVGGPGEFLRYVAPTLPVFLVACWLGGRGSRPELRCPSSACRWYPSSSIPTSTWATSGPSARYQRSCVPCSRRATFGSWPGTTGSITGTRTATTTSLLGGTSCWASTTGRARGILPRWRRSGCPSRDAGAWPTTLLGTAQRWARADPAPST